MFGRRTIFAKLAICMLGGFVGLVVGVPFSLIALGIVLYLVLIPLFSFVSFLFEILIPMLIVWYAMHFGFSLEPLKDHSLEKVVTEQVFDHGKK